VEIYGAGFLPALTLSYARDGICWNSKCPTVVLDYYILKLCVVA
jgi:hypothetical protein